MNLRNYLPVSFARLEGPFCRRHAFFAGLVFAILSGSAIGQAAARRQQGPCDIYAATHTPCVAAHSTTRALYASYNGPLYQLKRASDSRTVDIGIVQPTASIAGGYANAAAQDTFCANTVCVINRIYDQSGSGNDLLQAPPGTFKGPAPGGFDTLPIADMAPITIGGHKAYGIFIMPGMGFRNNNATGIAINDEPEGIYYVIDGTHYDSGCCFDYGNSSTNGRAVGTGTMETTYFGTSTAWGKGAGAGPWIMSDMEAGLFSGYGAKQNTEDPTIASWRFVTAVMDGGGGDRWDLRGGNAQSGGLTTFYSGQRPAPQRRGGYSPMHKQGGILLGTGGDNGNGSSGTFYEGVITSGYPTIATTDAVQANVVSARYDVPRLALSRITTFSPRSSQTLTVTFTNTTGAPATSVRLNLSGPNPHWTALVADTRQTSKTFAEVVAPGASVHARFNVTSPSGTSAGYLTGRVEWKNATDHAIHMETMSARVRNVPPVTINEVGFGAGGNSEHQFIELYNASSHNVDLSHWTLVSTASQWAPIHLATIPAGTTLDAHRFYLLALSDSGLAAPAVAGAQTIYVRDSHSLAAGQRIDVDGESRIIKYVGTPAAAKTTVFIPVSTGPWLRFPSGTKNLPVANVSNFAVGQRVGIGLGSKYEQVTVTSVGKAATQTVLVESASAGATNIKLLADSDVSAGDTLVISTGGRKEVVKVAAVGSAGAKGAGVDLTAPLGLDHTSGVDVSCVGTGLSFSPATRFPHTSAEAVQPLGSGVTLERPLVRNHSYGAPVTGPTDSKTGRQGPSPRQWFGDTLSSRAGSLVLLDASGTAVVDAIVYGSQQSNSSGNGTIVSPELATVEGEQGGGGCIVVVAHSVGDTEVSVGRYPDGADTDTNCKDFHVQAIADHIPTPGAPNKY
jgi:non-reducing end alpha-L-arabinofuranosidase